jgi:predicted GH43/DUF377 family glycosyl hydrolase
VEAIIGRVLGLPEDEVAATLAVTERSFADRHPDLRDVFSRNFDLVAGQVPPSLDISTARRLLIGAYFTHEYSIEATALNNPSIVASPDQSRARDGELAFIMSLRAIGEGHISSIEFRTGVILPDGGLLVDDPGQFPNTGRRTSVLFEKSFFATRLVELGALNELATDLLGALPDRFGIDHVESAIADMDRLGVDRSMAYETARIIHWLASSNYSVSFEPGSEVSERVIFPASPTESRGMEDARFVRFRDDDGSVGYYATYTAFDGHQILPQLIETSDFETFTIATLGGIRARNKGIALFPRRVGGRYAALSRYDNQNTYLMFSDSVRFWDKAERLQVPKQTWELVQIGNCGSPLETEGGWLIITHGVGPMRQYSLGAILLDLDDPQRVIGHLDQPILVPGTDERDGYVPNVVYSCGSIIHGGWLVLPYGFADEGTGVATVGLADLLNRLMDS